MTFLLPALRLFGNWKVLLAIGCVIAVFWLHHSIVKAAEIRTEARVSREMRAAYEEQARENARASAVLRSKLAFRNTEIMKLKGKVRHALSKPDAVCWNSRAVCLLAQARGYSCDASGGIPATLPPPSGSP